MQKNKFTANTYETVRESNFTSGHENIYSVQKINK